MSPAVDAYYPIGAAACCTPALLLDTGDAWCAASACLRGLARCACHVPLTNSVAVSSFMGQLRGQAPSGLFVVLKQLATCTGS